VLFVDRVAAHVDAIRQDGLRIDGPIAQFTARGEALLPQAVQGRFRLILLAVKAQDTEAATRALLPHLAEDGVVVSCQNGLNELIIAPIVGPRRTIGAFVNFGADWIAPGHITFGGRGAVVVGELDGQRSPRIVALHALLRDFEPNALLTEDIFGFLWSKVAYGAVLKSSALADDTLAEFFASARMRPLVIAIVQEVLRVATAERVAPKGFQGFDPDAFRRGDEAAIDESMQALIESRRGSAKLRSGIWRDLVVRRRPSEVAAQLAPVRDAARRHGLPTPLLDRLVELVAAVERGERRTGPDLAGELVDAAIAQQAA
jgi:2-dehydropantoate 2-reductase